jgi:hypothetical protein
MSLHRILLLPIEPDRQPLRSTGEQQQLHGEGFVARSQEGDVRAGHHHRHHRHRRRLRHRRYRLQVQGDRVSILTFKNIFGLFKNIFGLLKNIFGLFKNIFQGPVASFFSIKLYSQATNC